MELYELLNKICNRQSNQVPREDKRKYAYMCRRLFSAQFPIQMQMLNDLTSDQELTTSVISMMATRYNGIPNFLKLKVNQKKKKESIRKYFEDDVINKFMEINECGIREVDEMFSIERDEIMRMMKLIKQAFFDNSDKVIVEKKKEDKTKELF